VGAHPYSNAARDISATNALAKPFGEYHAESLLQTQRHQAAACILRQPKKRFCHSRSQSYGLGTRMDPPLRN
jgi:hypothetical protein